MRLAELMDGKLLVVNNVQDRVPEKVDERCKSLADIDLGFKVLTSELEIGPAYHHRLPERIWAHVSIFFMPLILHRVMRMLTRLPKLLALAGRRLRGINLQCPKWVSDTPP